MRRYNKDSIFYCMFLLSLLSDINIKKGMLLKPQNERVLKTFTASYTVFPCKQILGTCLLVTNEEFLIQCMLDTEHDDSACIISSALSNFMSSCSSSMQWGTQPSNTRAVLSVSQKAQSI